MDEQPSQDLNATSPSSSDEINTEEDILSIILSEDNATTLFVEITDRITDILTTIIELDDSEDVQGIVRPLHRTEDTEETSSGDVLEGQKTSDGDVQEGQRTSAGDVQEGQKQDGVTETQAQDSVENEDKEDSCIRLDTLEKQRAAQLVNSCMGSSRLLEVLVEVLNKLEMNKATVAAEALHQHIHSQNSSNNNAPCQEIPKEVKPKVRRHKEVLLESTGTFVDNLRLDRSLLALLEGRGVLNTDMVKKIRSRPNRPQQIKEFMGFMRELGPNSVGSFITALRETEQHALANILDAYEYV